MTRAQSIAYRIRWLLLIAAVLCMAFWLWSMAGFDPFGDEFFGAAGTPAMVPFLVNLDNGVLANNALFVAIVLLMQWMLLRPRQGWIPQMVKRGRPMKTTIIAAAFMGMLLSVGFIATVLELADQWPAIIEDQVLFYSVWVVMLIIWGVWGTVFFIYWRQGDRYTRLGKMIRGLLAGSVLESMIATWVYAANPHQESCYCARGSYTGLIFGGTVMVWCFGPGLVLLFLREKYRRQILIDGGHPQCIKCAYDLQGTMAAGRTQCPECGAAIGMKQEAGYTQQHSTPDDAQATSSKQTQGPPPDDQLPDDQLSDDQPTEDQASL